jgi:hypothetical protein
MAVGDLPMKEHWRRYRERAWITPEVGQITALDMDPAPPVLPGTVRATFGPVPAGWLVCNGAVVSRTAYAELFAIIGTGFGAGDGSTTFKLPTITQKLTSGQNPDVSWIIAT